MSAKDALGTIVVRAILLVIVLFLVAAWQTGMLADIWADLTDSVPSVDVTTK